MVIVRDPVPWPRNSHMIGSRSSALHLRSSASPGFLFASLRGAEHLLHLAAYPHRLGARVVIDVVPAHGGAFGNVALELHLVREADGQRLLRRGIARRHELPPHREAALPVEHLAR